MSRFLHRSSYIMAAATSVTTKPHIKVSVFSDLACPWCYVGKKRLDRAVAALGPQAGVKVDWHAYLLDPSFNPQGEDIKAYFRRKFGPDAEALAQRIRDAGTPDGAAFHAWNWRANTLPGHRLIALAKRYGKDHEANELLFKKTYEEGENISNEEVVIEVGQALGLPGVEEYVRDSGAGLEEVQRDDAFGKQMLGITGVPFFIVGADPPHEGSRRYVFSGALPAEEIQGVFQRVLAEVGENKAAARGAGAAGAAASAAAREE